MTEVINNADFITKAVSKNNYLEGSAILGCNQKATVIDIAGNPITDNFVASMDNRIAKHPGYYLSATTHSVTITVPKNVAWAGATSVLFQAPIEYGITITRVDMVVHGTDTPALTTNFEIRDWDLDSAGTEIWTADKVATDTGSTVSTIDAGTMSPAQYLLIKPISESGTVDEIIVTVYFQRT